MELSFGNPYETEFQNGTFQFETDKGFLYVAYFVSVFSDIVIEAGLADVPLYFFNFDIIRGQEEYRGMVYDIRIRDTIISILANFFA